MLRFRRVIQVGPFFVVFHHRYLVAAMDVQSLDRVSAYTAERASEPVSARLGSFRAARVETLSSISVRKGGKWAMNKNN